VASASRAAARRVVRAARPHAGPRAVAIPAAPAATVAAEEGSAVYI